MADLVAGAYGEALLRWASGDLLDLGCGLAPLYGCYAPLVGSVTCLDWSKTRHDKDYIDIEADLNSPLPLPSGSFDTVLLSDVLEHVSEPGLVIQEAFRVLRAEGRLILGVPFLYWIHEQPYDHMRYTEFELSRLCRRAGLKVLLLRPYGGPVEVLFDTAMKLASGLPAGRVWCWVLHSLAVVVGRLVSTRIRERIDRLFPLGYILVAERS